MSIFGALSGAISKTVGGITASGIGNALSGAYGMLSPAIGAGLSYKQSAALMDKQQGWLEKMSNTAYQRQVKDLVAAGINPLYGLSGGASTPSSGLASAPDYASAASMGTQNRLANSMNRAQIENLKYQSILAQNQGYKADFEAGLASKEYYNFDERFAANLDLTHAQAAAALQSGAASSAQASYYRSLENNQRLESMQRILNINYDSGYYDWFNSHKQARWRNYNERAGQFLPDVGVRGNLSNRGFGFNL